MADPLSLTGLAVGLTSLGFQLCQSTIQYLDGLQCREQDISYTRRQVEALQNVLGSIESTLSAIQSKHPTPSAAIKQCLDGCTTELAALEVLLTEIVNVATVSGSSIKDKVKGKARMLRYPFERPQIKLLEERLGRSNAVLQTALQTLEADLLLTATDKLDTTVTITRDMAGDVLVLRSEVAAAATSLQTIHSTTSLLNTRLDNLSTEKALTEVKAIAETMSRGATKVEMTARSVSNDILDAQSKLVRVEATTRSAAEDTASIKLLAEDTANGVQQIWSAAGAMDMRLRDTQTAVQSLSRQVTTDIGTSEERLLVEMKKLFREQSERLGTLESLLGQPESSQQALIRLVSKPTVLKEAINAVEYSRTSNWDPTLPLCPSACTLQNAGVLGFVTVSNVETASGRHSSSSARRQSEVTLVSAP